VTADKINIPLTTKIFDKEKLLKNTWLVLLHVNRIPPHVGLMIKGNYNSLTIKGQEINVAAEALLKTISLKKIESYFIRIALHPVFSTDYQLHTLHEFIKQFTRVQQNEATCLTPIKLFFHEFYLVNFIKDELLFQFIERLNANNYLHSASALNINMKEDSIELPTYTEKELEEIIIKQHLPE
jgi:hypothetical protein